MAIVFDDIEEGLSDREPLRYDLLYAYKWLDWPESPPSPEEWGERRHRNGKPILWRPRLKPRRPEAEAMLKWARTNRKQFLPMAMGAMKDSRKEKEEKKAAEAAESAALPEHLERGFEPCEALAFVEEWLAGRK